jgi:Fur family peroxide stress response transcriptional regulator
MSVSTPELERRIEEFRRLCREAGLRMTPQRLEIFREVARTDDHPDVESVRKRIRDRLPNVSPDTVYRTLALFEKLGLIRRIELLCDRARFDANTTRHHHFVCSECGRIEDFVSDEMDSYEPPAEVRSLGNVKSVHLQLRGVCNSCRTESEP